MIFTHIFLGLLLLFSSLFSEEVWAEAAEVVRTTVVDSLNSAIAINAPALFDEEAIRPFQHKTLTISGAGDFTIGSDDSFGYYGTFHHEYDEQGAAFFGENVKEIFAQDDLTIVNLETTLTTSRGKAEKKFRFSGKPEYADILTLSNIEAVTLANNHTHDYLKQGYDDTLKHLEERGIGHFGYDRLYLEEVNGVKVGAIGQKGWADTQAVRKQLDSDILSLRQQGAQIIIANFHWGEERHYVPNGQQQSLGRYAIDAGADLVLGHHPHVVQGIESYKDKYIVYSLGNFMFGGNRNPGDKDSFIFQQTFHMEGDALAEVQDIKIIPASISSLSSRNNYQPTPLKGKEAERVLKKIVGLGDEIMGNALSSNDFTIIGDEAVLSKTIEAAKD